MHPIVCYAVCMENLQKETRRHRSGLKMDARIMYDDPSEDVMNAMYEHARWLVQYKHEVGPVTLLVDRAIAEAAYA